MMMMITMLVILADDDDDDCDDDDDDCDNSREVSKHKFTAQYISQSYHINSHIIS
jgi:hypothetical protein